VHRAGGVFGILGELDRAGLLETRVPTVHSASLADALEDVLLNVLTATGARTQDATFNIAKFWRAAIDGVHSDRT